MSERLRFHDVLTLSPIEIRYVASCHPFSDRPGIEACRSMSGCLRSYVVSSPQASLTVSLADIAEPYPHLTRLARSGLFQKISPQAYFEGVSFPSAESSLVFHNPGLYLFAKRAIRQRLPPEVLRSIVDHIDGCSVKPAYRDEHSRWIQTTYGSTRLIAVDLSFLTHDDHSTPFLLTHGYAADGNHCAIRYISEEEYNMFHAWFMERERLSLLIRSK